VLEEVMHAEARNADVEKKILEVGRLIDSEDFAQAKSKLAELAELIGEGDPEITRATSMILPAFAQVVD
ncbi:MAG: hypothetical protein O3A00_24220, partial [Planctomycetota bacterium]|nr:hypothetical protein [Planctomycetota bacterium]